MQSRLEPLQAPPLPDPRKPPQGLALGWWLFPTRPLMALAVGGGTGGLVLTALYWRYVLPPRIRKRVLRALRIGT